MNINIFPQKTEKDKVATTLSVKIARSNSENVGSVSATWRLEDNDGKILKVGLAGISSSFLTDKEICDLVTSELSIQQITLNNLKKMKTKIESVSLEGKIATQFVIDYIQIKEFNDTGVAVVSWSFLSEEEDEPIYRGSSIIEGEEYSNWGSDDSYVTDLMLQKLSLTRVIETSLVEPETVTENTIYQEILDQLDN